MSEKKKILIIDDDRDLVESVKAALEETGAYQVEFETDSTKGRSVAQAIKPDLILLDVLMPKMSGGEVAREIISNPETKDIPLVFFSVIASKTELNVRQGMIGGRPFLAKPVAAEELIRCIERHLKRCDSISTM